ncbi:hypothetical protein D8674_005485 [Pyrus ussuriensis x Pyrus communis]|uniref:Uncharacterized protein n=1 Tax=Pyrus ussuriensis x Pyrus communis TaxID=2448454 RepID=A0A5N5FRK7_9ROSA|nr:hypothetical protein D8674_005485 [Pyrus ussuriensis x Pyrus communis]
MKEEAHLPEAFGGSFQRRKKLEGDKNMESGLIDKNMTLKNNNDHWAFLASEVTAAKFMKRKTELVETDNVENSMLKFTGRVKLKATGV